MSNFKLTDSIVIADFGTGNLRSVAKAVAHVSDAKVQVSEKPDDIANAGHLILPGQGALGAWVARLDDNIELRDALIARLQAGPVLGICLGLQALYTRSEENGGMPGLNILAGTVRHFNTVCGNGHADAHDNRHDKNRRLKIPHMGWNRVRQTRDHPLWHRIADSERFYFVHSYFAAGEVDAEIVGECDYGGTFTAAAARDNLFAVQFHPEKSQAAGLRLLKNFIKWDGNWGGN